MKEGWTTEKDAKLRELIAAGLTWEQIGRHFGFKKDAPRRRWEVLNETPERRADRLEKRRIYKANLKWRDKIEPGSPVRRLEVPANVIAERNARAIAPTTLTGFTFGDPPRGFSALDRKMAEVRA